jgi:hypothetical protein
MFIMVGESVSGTYCGIGGGSSRVIEPRAADEDEGRCRCFLFAGLEQLDMEEAVLRRLDAPRRCEARGTVPMPSSIRPPRLPISVDVRSIDMTPGPAEERRSCLVRPPPSPAGLLVARDMAERLEARLVRPLTGPLGSLLLSMMPLQLRKCYSV